MIYNKNDLHILKPFPNVAACEYYDPDHTLGPYSKRQLELNSKFNSKAELRVQLKFKGKMVF